MRSGEGTLAWPMSLPLISFIFLPVISRGDTGNGFKCVREIGTGAKMKLRADFLKAERRCF